MLQQRQNLIMMNFLKNLSSPRFRISVLLTVSILVMLICYRNLPILYIGLIELLVFTGCVVFFKKVDITQYELFLYKPHWFWRICEWYWTLWFCFKFIMPRLIRKYPSLLHFPYELNKVFRYFPDISGYEFYISLLIILPIIVLTMPLCIYLFRCIFKPVSELFLNVTQFEKHFLVLSSSILIVILLIVCSKTSFFVYPTHTDNYISESSDKINMKYYDINNFFETDTYSFFANPMYSYYDDTFRHPFFSFVFLLFMPLIQLIAFAVNMVYESQAYSFAISVGIVQIFLYVSCVIPISRLYSFFTPRWFYQLLSVMYVCSFPVIFSIVPERLIFTSFFLIYSVYFILNNRIAYNTINTIFISFGAIGTTSLSIIPITFALFLRKKIKVILLLLGLSVVIILSRNLFFSHGIYGINHCFEQCNQFSIKKSLVNNYTQLIYSCFMLPSYEIIERLPYGINDNAFFSMWIVQKSSVRDIAIGIVTICLCLLSIVHSFRFSIVKISGFWLFISFALIGVIGFGNSQCVLYCSYFSWAIIPLTLLPFYWLWQKYPRLPIPQALYLFAAYLAISNLYFIYQVVQVVSERYIVPPGM